MRGSMGYGTFLGDGSERGPDFTAEALHIMAVSMNTYYTCKVKGGGKSNRKSPWRDSSYGVGVHGPLAQHVLDGVALRVRKELHYNTYDKEREVIVLNEAQMEAWKDVATHYRRTYQQTGYTDLWPVDHIKDPKYVEDRGGWR